MCVCVKLKFQFTTGGNWKSSKWHASSLETFSLFLVFSVQTKPKNTVTFERNVHGSREQTKNISTLKCAFLIQIGLIIFLFCRLNCLFQVEVFEAIQHILTSRAVENSKACQHIKYGNWIQSKQGIKYKCWKSKAGYFIHCMTGRKVKFTWSDQNTNRFLKNLKI